MFQQLERSLLDLFQYLLTIQYHVRAIFFKSNPGMILNLVLGIFLVGSLSLPGIFMFLIDGNITRSGMDDLQSSISQVLHEIHDVGSFLRIIFTCTVLTT